jgi:hypothetical protein
VNRLGVTPGVAFAYLRVAAFLFALSRSPEMMAALKVAPKPVPAE